MKGIEEVFARLERSSFRRRIRLNEHDREYLARKGLEVVLQHATDFIATRLAPAEPPNDGKQTPWRGHPAFVAQHATATCCRSCLEKWHSIPRGQELDAEERGYVLEVIGKWLAEKGKADAEKSPRELELF